jgi:hypothetical protein
MQVAKIENSMKLIETKSNGCLRFVRKDSSHPTWISIRNLGGCFSAVSFDHSESL